MNCIQWTLPISRLVAVAICAASVGLASRPAHANGRYPAAGLIAVDPADPDHIVVRTTYGIVSTADGGDTWTWVCERSIGFNDNEDPMVVLTANGTLLAGVSKGLSVSTDRGCGWSYVGGELADRYVLDLATEKKSQERAVAILSNGIGGGKYNTQVFETADNGVIWTQAGTTLPEEFWGVTVDVAPSDTSRLYASGRYGEPDYQGIIERSDDRGKTWTRFDVTGADSQHLPFLSAIDPGDPDVLYVRLDAPEADVLVVSKDGGQSWENAFSGKGALLGFALSPDGKKVAVGGTTDGIWMAPSNTLAFTKVSDVGAKCLLWTEDTLFACADEAKQGFTVGASKNEGQTFVPLLHLHDICPLQCASDTTTGKTCADQWPPLALTGNVNACTQGSGESPATSSGSGSGTSMDGGGADCSCGVAGGGVAGGGLALVAAGLSAWARRRRRP